MIVVSELIKSCIYYVHTTVVVQSVAFIHLLTSHIIAWYIHEECKLELLQDINIVNMNTSCPL